MKYEEAMQQLEAGHAVARSSWNLPNVCIVSFNPGKRTWLDGHKVLPWSPSEECKKADDWILADDVRERDAQTRRASVEALRKLFEGPT
jgi:hypothetical protein